MTRKRGQPRRKGANQDLGKYAFKFVLLALHPIVINDGSIELCALSNY